MNGKEELSPLWSNLQRISRSIGAKLFLLLAGSLLIVLGLLGYINLRLHQGDLEDLTLMSAERVSDVIKRSTAYHMMRNDRDALYQTIRMIANEPGVTRIRIFNQEGQISFSSQTDEIGTFVDKTSHACSGCHSATTPVAQLSRTERFRIFESSGQRMVRVINPITNSRSCSEADCHAHPSSQRVLGVLDTNLSLASADEHLIRSNRRVLTFSILGMIGVVVLTAIFTWRVVHRPVGRLHEATQRLQQGELGYETEVLSNDQLGELAKSFNEMSRELEDAHTKLTEWNRRLEERVREKSAELQLAHDSMLQAEKLTSLGKLAAVVAHEINNPLMGILTYARLIRRWLEQEGVSPERVDEIVSSLRLIESESRRCGSLVKDLLAFARPTPMNVKMIDVNEILRTCLRLVAHKLDLSGTARKLELDENLPDVEADPAQIEQLFLALIMNAIDAMPREGCLTVRSRLLASIDQVEITIEDNGVGIPEEVRSKLFEPFVTTKEDGRGVGLGLAISRRIIERHSGRIDVDSRVGQGTTFTISLPTRLPRGAQQALSEAV